MIPNRDGRIEDVTTEDPGPRWREALASVLVAIVAATTTGVVVVANLSSLLLPPTLVGVQGVTHVAVIA
jgi:predicted secreted protein